MKLHNRNTLWAHVFVNSLVKSGLSTVCISPGSRSTPLALAFHENPEIEVFSILDERGAGYFAIGMAQESKKTVALVCTSGTAVANYFPAVVEANYSNVPLLLLTADRPHELRDSGANQSIDQIKIFGNHVRWFVDLALPESNPSLKTLRYLNNIGCRAVSKSNSILAGPVHINMPFRKPFEPIEVSEDFGNTWYENNKFAIDELLKSKLELSVGKINPTQGQIDTLSSLIKENTKILIVCGPKTPKGQFSEKISELAILSKSPILIDSLSGLRFNSLFEDDAVVGVSAYESFLASNFLNKIDPPELIIQFGHSPISKSLQTYLSGLDNTRRIQVTANGIWADEDYRVTDQIWADPEELIKQVIESLQDWKREDSQWLDNWEILEKITWKKTNDLLNNEWFEGAIVSEMIEILPDESNLFVASSLPIRHLDQFGKITKKNINIFANRGASGIDGTVSTALGIAAASKKPILLLTGDLSFYHDLNALLAVKKYNLKIIVVLINNDGGGIFQRLPIAKYEPQFTELFLTPHGLTFEKTAEQFSIEYSKVDNREDFIKVFQKSINNQQSIIIEVLGDSVKHEEKRKVLIKLLNNIV